MSKHLIIAPSILSLDYSHVDEQLDALRHSKAEWLHFDVMDGHFVPNLTFGPDILSGFKKACPLFMDVHLMVDNPEFFAPIFIEHGADMITFHTEALENDPMRIKNLINLIHSQGAKAGITVKPKTKIEPFVDVLGDLDMVLIMSVEPGFGGQSFMEDQLEKVEWLDHMRKELGLPFLIEIDGGINGSTYKKAIQSGCDVLVAGSYVFKGDIIHSIESLLQ